MRLHVVALPHTQVTRAFDWCAYTAKLRRLPAMLAAHGHRVVLYAGTDIDPATAAACEEVVTVVDDADLARWFGGPWPTDQVFNRWDDTDPCWVEMNAQAVRAIAPRLQPGDALGLIAGQCQQALRNAFPTHLALEWGVGYVGVLDSTFRAFESSSWQAFVAGKYGDDRGRLYDTVIPNAYDPAEFYEADPDDYLLFLGRNIPDKGTAIVAELAKHHRVVSAGQGGPIDGCAYYGVVTGSAKAELLARAKAVLVPTLYREPFGGVAVEAMMSGTPVITTDFGAFRETVLDGISGFRCATLAEFRRAAVQVDALSRDETRAWAHAHFETDHVARQYDRWLGRLATLRGEGWYSE